MNFRNALESLAFDDVLVVPQYSDIASRQEVNVSTRILGINLEIPIVSSPMTTVTEFTMAKALENLGGLGILHRYTDPALICRWLSLLKYPVPSVGTSEQDKATALLYRKFTNRICVDTAHGHTKACGDMVSYLREVGYDYVMAGSVATHSGAEFLAKAGATDIRVGIGGGSVCTTRIVSGHGLPTLTSVAEVAQKKAERGYTVIADGGIRNSGDAVKSLAVGADAVMLGHMLAGTEEAPSVYNTDGKRTYAGMASADVQLAKHGSIHNNTAEGISVPLNAFVPLKETIDFIVGGLRSGLSYSGARNLIDFQHKAQLVRITEASLRESYPHAR